MLAGMIMLRRLHFAVLLGFLAAAPYARGQEAYESIKPSKADAEVHQYDDANVILRPRNMQGAPLAVFLPGTTGKPENLLKILHVLTDQGYRAIGLEYDDTPAVGQACPRNPDVDCASKFRAMRVWGETAKTGEAPVINSVAEAIVPRLIALLKELDRKHPKEGWGAFLTADGQPVWSRILVSGQSQGAGMAAFIAKREKVARVVCFSSPMDLAAGGVRNGFAPWLTWPSATPMDRWYAVRNAREPLGPFLTKSYPLMGIPADHIRVFSLDLPEGVDSSNPLVYHGINLRDPRYLPEWKFLFGSASDVR